MKLNNCYIGDCQEILGWNTVFPDECVDLIVTSPPYAEKRKHTYGGIKPIDYVDWFEMKAYQFHRVLKPGGSFILNIKEGAKDYELQTYVYELVLKMKQEWNWLWVNDYCWHKKNAYPGKYPNRLKDTWEHCYHFTKQKKIAFYPDAVMVEAAESSIKRAKSLSEQDRKRQESGTGSKFGVNRSKCGGRRIRKTGSLFTSNDAGFDKRLLNQVNGKPSATGSGFDVERPIRSLGEYQGNGGLKKIPEDGISRKPMVYPPNVLHLPAEYRNRGHSAVFPEALPEFFIKLLTKPGDLVLDPFMGSGTTAAVAKRLGRNWIGCEKKSEYWKVIMERVNKDVEGGAA